MDPLYYPSTSNLWQKGIVYNQFLPYSSNINDDSIRCLSRIKEIMWQSLNTEVEKTRENKINKWVDALEKFISLYGLYFSKHDHILLIKVAFKFLTCAELRLNPITLNYCANVLISLLKKRYLLSRVDLVLPWRPLYEMLRNWEETRLTTRTMVIPSSGLKQNLLQVIKFSRFYFSDEATAEILDEWRPSMCPFNAGMTTAMFYCSLFLPMANEIPAELSYQLWFNEFLSFWRTWSNNPVWEVHIFKLFSRLSKLHHDKINWEPLIPDFFTRFMTALNLPVTFGNSGIRQQYGLSGSPTAVYFMTHWIVNAMGQNSTTDLMLTYLDRMLLAIESYFHPANSNCASEMLNAFIALLVTDFVKRLHNERYDSYPLMITPERFRLSDEIVNRFVTSLLPIAFHVLYSSGFDEERRSIFNSLSTLRPQLILPRLLDKFNSATNILTEPHRLTACITALSACARSLVAYFPRETIIHLLTSLLPGIDVNDIWKCTDVFILISDLLEMIWLDDAFENFVISFTDRCVTLIEDSSRHQTRSETSVTDDLLNEEEVAADAAISDSFQKIVQRCSPKTFEIVFSKLYCYIEQRILEPTVAGSILAGMCKSVSLISPLETYKFFIPHLCKRIGIIMTDRVSVVTPTNTESDRELMYNLLILSEVISVKAARWHSKCNLALYMDMLDQVFRLTMHLHRKDEHEYATNVLENVLHNLVHVRPLDLDLHRRGKWGEMSDLNTLRIEWYVPGKAEIEITQDLVNKYLSSPLERLHNFATRQTVLDKEEVFRCIRLVFKILWGISEIIPPLGGIDQCHSTIDNTIFTHNQLIGHITLGGKSIRDCVLDVMHTTLRHLLSVSSDDTESMNGIISILDILIFDFGLDEDDLYDHIEEYKLMKKHRANLLVGEKRHLKSVLIDRITIQHQIHIWIHNYFDKNCLPSLMLKDILHLSTSRYSEVRISAQELLFKILGRWMPEIAPEILPHLKHCLSNGENVTEDMLKGALHIISEEKFLFFYNWDCALQLWPSLVKAQHSDKHSIVELLKTISAKFDRRATEYCLYTLPMKMVGGNTELKELALLVSPTVPSNTTKTSETSNLSPVTSKVFIKLQKQLHALVIRDDIHWRHAEMASLMLISFIGPEYEPPDVIIIFWLNCLLHENRNIRIMAFQAVECIFKLCLSPRKNFIIKDHVSNYDNNGVVIPGLRSDNEWLQYHSDMTQDQLRHYWSQPFSVKCHTGFYVWPKKLKLRTMEVNNDDCLQKMPELVFDFFSNSTNFDRFIALNMVEEDKTGEGVFSLQKGLFFCRLFETFGDRLMPYFQPVLERLNLSIEESEQRLASEIVYGILKGSRFWPYDRCQKLWIDFLTPYLDIVFSAITQETLGDWDSCLSAATNKVDPNRIRWLIELMLNKHLTNETGGVFRTSVLLRLFNKIIIQNWRLKEVYVRMYTHLRHHWDSPHNKIRLQVAKFMALLVGIDLGDGSFPSRHQFIQDILPKLSLNFYNPEFANQNRIEVEEPSDNCLLLNRRGLYNIEEDLINGDEDDSVVDDGMSSEKSSKMVLEMVANWVQQFVQISSLSISRHFYDLLPFLCQFIGVETDIEISQACLSALCHLSVCIVPISVVPTVLQMSHKIGQSQSWKAKISILEFIQVFVFTNFMLICNNEGMVRQIENLIVEMLADLSIIVRQKAAKVLGGLVHSHFLDDAACRRLLLCFNSNVRLKMERCGEKQRTRFKRLDVSSDVALMAKFHSGILGLCAFVEAFPYEVPKFVPGILMLLEGHLHDPQPIPRTIKNTLQEFKRTHQDNWNEHKLQFTEDQLVVMTNLLVSPNYYA